LQELTAVDVVVRGAAVLGWIGLWHLRFGLCSLVGGLVGCVDSRRAEEQQRWVGLFLMVEAEFGGGEEGPDKLLDGGFVLGF
jgi:hypothetical protein